MSNVYGTRNRRFCMYLTGNVCISNMRISDEIKAFNDKKSSYKAINRKWITVISFKILEWGG